jgi:hypothetical protein
VAGSKVTDGAGEALVVGSGVAVSVGTGRVAVGDAVRVGGAGVFVGSADRQPVATITATRIDPATLSFRRRRAAPPSPA